MALGSNMKGGTDKNKGLVSEIKKSRSSAAKTKQTAAKNKKVQAIKPKIQSTKSKKSSAESKAVAKQKNSPKKKKELIPLMNAAIVLEPSMRKKIRKTRVYLEGELTVSNVDAFTERIDPIFNDYDYVDFSLREVTTIDLSYIQMLYYYQKAFAVKNKTVTIDSKLSPDLKKVIVHAGFEELMFIPKLV